jgi:tRNA A-37 threonylcarbamoyl transferase component Bud32
MIGLRNKRGMTSRGLTEGGQQEYDLAARYNAWAEAIEVTHPRTAAALRGVAESYREEGRRNDDEVRRYLEGLDT